MLPIQPRAVVTGAASGLGRAFALQLADRRARLVLSDLDEDALDSVSGLVLPALDDARAAGLVTAVPADLSARYLAGVRAMALHPGSGAPLRIAYTALHGPLTARLLQRLSRR